MADVKRTDKGTAEIGGADRGPADGGAEGRSPGKVLTQGAVAGLAAAAGVALWFLMVDSVNGQPLFTPAALGSALFLRATSREAIEITLVTVGGYTVVHGAIFTAIGVAAAALLEAARRRPTLLAGAILLVVAFEAFFVGAVAIVAQFLLGEVAWWAILGGNAVAAILMGRLLLAWNPEVARRLTRTDPLGEQP